ncbi:hypothetical protein ABFA07_003528 [Porites harrisoni]
MLSRQRWFTYADCYGQSSLTSIPAGLPADTAILMLYNTGLSNIPQNAFQGLSNLKEINIQSNPLTSIAGNAFQGVAKLNILILSRNNLSQVTADSFKGLTAVTKMYLEYNDFAMFPDGLFEDTFSLQYLKIGNNKLTAISANLFNKLSNLVLLSLSNNKISSVSPESFSSMKSNLTHLNLDNNHLNKFPVESLENLTALSELRLASNAFYTIPQEAVTIFDKIAAKVRGHIWIANNPLVCTKELKWLQTWMTSHPTVVKDLNKVTCQTPYGNRSKVFDFDFSILDGWTIGNLKSSTIVINCNINYATNFHSRNNTNVYIIHNNSAY